MLQHLFQHLTDKSYSLYGISISKPQSLKRVYVTSWMTFPAMALAFAISSSPVYIMIESVSP